MTRGRRRRVDEIPGEQSAVAGANIRILRQRHGWSQAQAGELMGWPGNAAHDAVYRLRREPARRIRLPGMRSPMPAGPGAQRGPVPGQDGDDVSRRVSQLAEG